MLLGIRVKNLYSFKENQYFSMIADKGTRHSEHLYVDEAGKLPRLLRMALIYGKNAAGKSNLVKVITFLKELVLEGTKLRKPIARTIFKLDPEYLSQNSEIEIEFTIENIVHNYSIVFDNRTIWDEKLSKYEHGEKILFHRKTIDDGEFYLEKIFPGDRKGKKKKELENGTRTRKNQLLLTHLAESGIDDFIEVYDWFNFNLKVIDPRTKWNYKPILSENEKFLENFKAIIQEFDLDIDDLCLNRTTLVEAHKYIPESLMSEITDRLNASDGEVLSLISIPDLSFFRFELTKEKEIKVFKIRAKPKNSKDVYFDLDELSDGTLRIFDFIPMLIMLREMDVTFIIDEINRSLHPMLTRKLFELFQDPLNKFKGQVIATTHDEYVLDYDFVRKDEIWFVEKNFKGESQLYSLSDFKTSNDSKGNKISVRTDRNLRNDYLKGRFGGIPDVT